MKIKTIALILGLTALSVIGIHKQKEKQYFSDETLVNLSAICDNEGSIDIEYDKACIDQKGDGCCLSSTDWRPNETPYN